MYGKLNVMKFEGVNSELASTLIKDGEARDIVNLRMDKLGKLNTRNGCIFGAFTVNTSQAFGGIGVSNNDDLKTIDNYVANCGILGIGELKLSNKWDLLDADRFMVYALRGVDNPNYTGAKTDLSTSQFKYAAYLLAPLNGQYKNCVLYYSPSDVATAYGLGNEINLTGVLDLVDDDPKGTEESIQLYAPNKNLPDYIDMDLSALPTYQRVSVPTLEEDTENSQYIEMNQYRNKLVISDRINGDMILENEYDITDKKVNKLHLRPNSLSEFDVSHVLLYPRTGTGEENASGVESPMALYKYVLPKKNVELTDDNYNGLIGDGVPSVQSPSWAQGFYNENTKRVANGRTDTLFSLFEFAPAASILGVDFPDLIAPLAGHRYPVTYAKNNYDMADAAMTEEDGFPFLANCVIKTDRRYKFTNAEQAIEYDDVLGKVKLSREKYVNPDGTVDYDVAPDVWLWDDFRRKYYLCSGTTYQSGNYLRDLDRLFSKLNPGQPRITKLVSHQGKGKEVPLGVWKYRFVWDYGNGEFSAPSADMCAPDAMWSIVQDDELTNGANYARPKYYDESELEKTGIPQQSPFDWSGSPVEIDHPSIFTLSGPNLVLTPFGEAFMSLKYQLYKGMNHKFAIPSSVTSVDDVVAYVNGLTSKKSLAQLAVQSTAFFSQSDLLMKGFIWEGAASYWNPNESLHTWKDDYRADFKATTTTFTVHMKPYTGLDKYAFVSKGQLVVPIFPTTSNVITHNSLFDNDGKLRLTYERAAQNSIDIGDDGGPHYTPTQYIKKLIFPGANCGIGRMLWDGTYDPIDGLVPLGRCIPQKMLYYHYLLDLQAGTSGRLLKGMLHITSASCYMTYDILSADMAGRDGNIYVNINSIEEDKNNIDSATDNLFDKRPHTLFRGVKEETDKLNVVNGDVPPQVFERLVLEGQCGIEVIDFGDSVSFDSEEINYESQMDYIGIIAWAYEHEANANYPKRAQRIYQDDKGDSVTMEGNPLGASASTSAKAAARNRNLREGITNYAFAQVIPYEYGHTFSLQDTSHIDNLRVVVYANDAQRLIATEQLTSYFPSSLIFKSPRLGLFVETANVPPRAKKLLVFRTKCSHANDFSPNDYGLVANIEIRRKSAQDNPSGSGAIAMGDSMYYDTVTSTWKAGLPYFDQIKDNELDFSWNIQEYDGIRKALKSRFNTALYEQMFYANFKEEWRPLRPKYEYGDAAGIRAPFYTLFDVASGGYPDHSAVIYKITFEDILGNESVAGIVPYLQTEQAIRISATSNQVVVLQFLPALYSSYIQKLKIYRSKGTWAFDGGFPVFTMGDYFFIGEILGTTAQGEVQYNEGIFVDDNLPDGALYIDKGSLITDYTSGLRRSEAFRPDMLKTENIWEFGSGETGEITGLETLFGSLLVFKNNSIYRFQETPYRVDKVAEIGCIAPHTLININNVLYFLSHQGFYAYDNNSFKKIDLPFDEELQFIMTANKDTIWESTCGYNKHYGELYLNVPAVISTQDEFGLGRKIEGNIYVISMEKGYITKFSYPKDSFDIEGGEKIQFTSDGRQLVRLYYTNSLGEMRSADIVPTKYLLKP